MNYVPPTSNITIFCSYSRGKENLKIETDVEIPLSCLTVVEEYSPNGKFKIYLDGKLNSDSVESLNDFHFASFRTTQNSFSLLFFNGVKCHISISPVGKYFLQSNTLIGTGIILSRILDFTNKLGSGNSIEISFEEDHLINEYFEVIDLHLELRKKVKAYKTNLDNLGLQFRAIQKKLLCKHIEKSLHNVDGLKILLKETFENVLFHLL